MKHTPGPWFYDHQDNQALIVDTQGFTVVELSTLENSTAHSSLADNARLIAAAPDLLAALKGILYHFVPMQGTLKVEDEMIKQAHAAINKTTGE